MAGQEPVRWALVGTSEFALDWIAPAIVASPGASLAAIVSSSAHRARLVAARMGVPIATDSLAELDPADVDVVHLVTPNVLHEPHTLQALGRGLHVVVEKPMALDVGQARRMVEAASEAGRMLAVAHCMAWAPPVEAAARLLADGAVGLPVELRIAAGFDHPPTGTWRQETPTEDGGGPWMDLGPHAVDAAIRLMGPVAGVSAAIDRLRYDYPAEDAVGALIRFQTGALGAIRTTFVAGQNELLVQGTTGALRSREWLGRDFAGDLVLESADRGVGRFEDDTAPGPAVRPIELTRTNVYQPQVAELCQAVRSGGRSRIDGRHGLEVMAVLVAGIRAARERREVSVAEVLG